MRLKGQTYRARCVQDVYRFGFVVYEEYFSVSILWQRENQTIRSP